MSLAAGPLPSPAQFSMPPSNLRGPADHQDLVMHSPFSRGLSASTIPRVPSTSYLSLSPGTPLASQNRTAFAELLQSRTSTKLQYSPSSQSPLSKALSSPRSLSSLAGSDGHRSTKENRPGHASGPPKTEDADKGAVKREPLQRKRPARLAIPEAARLASPEKAKQFIPPETSTSETYHHEAELFAVASKRGRKDRMEDAHTTSTHFHGDSKQAFFGVFDGHGGKQAAEFAAANLSRHVSAALQNRMDGETCVEDAMRTAYRNTDAEFLDQRVSSGACAVSLLVKEGEMVVANAGDCKAVLCRAGKAESLSTLHRASNEVERQRIEDLGGFVDCYNGTWRLQGTLAVTRAFGDANLKQWVSVEPTIERRVITHDCEFLILASDGLWDQMSDQEAVDCARKILSEVNVLKPMSTNKNQGCLFATSLPYAQKTEDCTLQAYTNKTNACNELIRIACHRGNCDDITVMIVPLQTFNIAVC